MAAKKHISQKLSMSNRKAIEEARKGKFDKLKECIDIEYKLATSITHSQEVSIQRWSVGMRVFHSEIHSYLKNQLETLVDLYEKRRNR